MLRKNVVLIKKKRNENNKIKINSFFRTFFMVSMVITCVISVFLFSVVVDEKSKQVGFGIKDSTIEFLENDTSYVMNFFSKSVEINKDEAQENIDTAFDFVMCFVNPIIRIVWQSVELIT